MTTDPMYVPESANERLKARSVTSTRRDSKLCTDGKCTPAFTTAPSFISHAINNCLTQIFLALSISAHIDIINAYDVVGEDRSITPVCSHGAAHLQRSAGGVLLSPQSSLSHLFLGWPTDGPEYPWKAWLRGQRMS